MTRKKRNLVIASISIIGIAVGLFLMSNLFSSSNLIVEDSEASEVDFQERLLEYSEFELYFDDEIQGFFYDGQRVRRLVDGGLLYQYDEGIGEITIKRNSEGKIINFDVK